MLTGTAAAGLLVLAGTASAHVTITPGSAAAGSAAELTFRVPNEEARASSVELQVQVPAGQPIAQLLPRPVPGWTVSVRTARLAHPLVTDDGSFTSAVSEVTWRGGRIPPGQYEDFSLWADPLPAAAGQLVFKAIQTYSNGDVVRWIDLPQPGQPVPDHPAPVLTLTRPGTPAVTAASGTGANGTGAASAGGVAVTAVPAAPGGRDWLAVALGAAGLAAGVLGLAAGLSAWRRERPRGQRTARP